MSDVCEYIIFARDVLGFKLIEIARDLYPDDYRKYEEASTYRERRRLYLMLEKRIWFRYNYCLDQLFSRSISPGGLLQTVNLDIAYDFYHNYRMKRDVYVLQHEKYDKRDEYLIGKKKEWKHQTKHERALYHSLYALLVFSRKVIGNDDLYKKMYYTHVKAYQSYRIEHGKDIWHLSLSSDFVKAYFAAILLAYCLRYRQGNCDVFVRFLSIYPPRSRSDFARYFSSALKYIMQF